jgi:hypothetical protein
MSQSIAVPAAAASSSREPARNHRFLWLLALMAASRLLAADGLDVVGTAGKRHLMLANRPLAEVGSPWVASKTWSYLGGFTSGPEQRQSDGGATRRLRSSDDASGAWRETITSQADAITVRYDVDLKQPADAMLMQWIWHFDSDVFANARLRGEGRGPLAARTVASADVRHLKQLTLMLADLDIDLSLSSSDGAWSFQDLREKPYANSFRLAFERSMNADAPRSCWFEITARTRPAKNTWRPLVAELAAGLDGTWSVQAEGGPARDVQVPGFLDDAPDLRAFHRFTYRRTFDVPEAMAGARRVIRFDAVGDAAEVVVNGRLVGSHVGPALPFEVDITDATEAGSTGNTLEVAVRDDTWYGAPRDELAFRARRHRIPRGMGTDNRKGLFQSVSLRARPEVRIDDVRITTAVRKDELAIACELVNDSSRAVSVLLDGDVVPAAAAQPALALPRRTCDLPAFTRTQLMLITPLRGLKRWQPDQPTLHHARLRLTLANNAELNRVETRFGVREVWFEGPNLMLNGVRCNLRGESPAYAEKIPYFATRTTAADMLRRYREANCNTLRFHGMPPPPHVLDLCDEMGMLVIGESSIYGSWGMTMPEHPDWIANCREHLVRWIRRDRNHPSVILWSAANEATGPGRLSRAMLAICKETIDAEDGTRPVIFDGDGTVDGLSPVNSKHYPLTIDDLQHLDGKASGYGCDMRPDIYWPAAFRQTVPMSCGEFLFPHEPGMGGDEHAVIVMMGLQTRGYRYAGWFDIRPYNPSYCGFLRPEGVRGGFADAYEIIRASFAPVAVFDKEYDTLGPKPEPPRLRVGSAATRTLIVYNDEFSDDDVTVAWRLLADGRSVAQETLSLSVPLGDHIEVPITIVPPVRGDLTLELTSRKAGVVRFAETRRFTAE